MGKVILPKKIPITYLPFGTNYNNKKKKVGSGYYLENGLWYTGDKLIMRNDTLVDCDECPCDMDCDPECLINESGWRACEQGGATWEGYTDDDFWPPYGRVTARFEDSNNCDGSNGYRQCALLSRTICICGGLPRRLNLCAKGNVETQDPTYDCIKARITSVPNDYQLHENMPCDPDDGPIPGIDCQSCSLSIGAGFIDLCSDKSNGGCTMEAACAYGFIDFPTVTPPGQLFRLDLLADTTDCLFHVDSYWEVTFQYTSIPDMPISKACECCDVDQSPCYNYICDLCSYCNTCRINGWETCPPDAFEFCKDYICFLPPCTECGTTPCP